MQQYKKAEITVFLTFLLSSVFLFICALIESGRLSAFRFEIEAITQEGLISGFAEYERNLLDRYDLFYIDSGYRGSSSPGIKSYENHLRAYIEETIDCEETGNLINPILKKIETNKYCLASDNSGEVIMNQASQYIYEYGTIIFYPKAEQNLQKMKSVKHNNFISEWDRLIAESEAMGAVFNNPARIVRNMCGDEYYLITEGLNSPSGYISYADIPSIRSLEHGNGSMTQNSSAGFNRETCFNEYLVKKFGCFTYPNGQGPLTCELEYIAYGNDNDEGNLRDTISYIMSVREGANLSAIHSDSGMMEAVSELTWRVMDLYDDPALFEVLREAIIFSWAYAEAAVEVHGLLTGGLCPIDNNTEGWIVDINSLISFKECMGNTRGTGISYREYMASIICNESIKTRRMRMCDLIEMNIRAMGNGGFKIDGCIEYAMISAYFESKYGYSKYVTRDRSYVR